MTAYQAELYHHGIKGQKWGVRRYQNSDGSLTAAGRERYDSLSDRQKKKYDKFEKSINRQIEKSKQRDEKFSQARQKRLNKATEKLDKKIDRLKKDVHSFDPIKNGLKDDKGRELLSKEDVRNSVNALKNKIAKIEQKRKTKVRDAKDYSRYLAKGEKQYNDVLTKYRDAKLSSFLDSGIKKDPAYKEAVRKYTLQSINDANNYGMSDWTKLNYSSRNTP